MKAKSEGQVEQEGCKKEGVAYPGGWHFHRCRKLAWKDGYCKIHHPASVEENRVKSQKRFEEKQKNSPWALLETANRRIVELENEIELLKRGTQQGHFGRE